MIGNKVRFQKRCVLQKFECNRIRLITKLSDASGYNKYQKRNPLLSIKIVELPVIVKWL